jgi:curved DNA-binding protein CbpA
MAQVHTHYDNLKVTRNAPPEVIRAAYKSLSQKFHPDRNPENPNATRTFQLISQAYEVLSDPLKRRDHDNWIANVEAQAAQGEAAATAAAAAAAATPAARPSGRARHFSQSRTASAAWSAQVAQWNSRTWQPPFDTHRWRRQLWRMQGVASTTRARLNTHQLSRLFFCLVLAMLLVVAVFSDY